MITTSFLLAFGLRAVFKIKRPILVAQILAAWVFWIPMIQFLLGPYNPALGPSYGPAVHGFLSCHTILIPSVYAGAAALEPLQFNSQFHPLVRDAVTAMLAVIPFRMMETGLQLVIPRALAWSPSLSPVHFQLLLGAVHSSLGQSWMVIFAFPALMYTPLANPHFNPSVANTTLNEIEWSLLDRAYSPIGGTYVSVLENMAESYKVLRAGHSLLGGEWLLTDERREKEGWKVNEPVYAAMEMLEAVRLVKVGGKPVPDNKAHALVVGLGAGTVAKAMLMHGVRTTIVEIDPVVYRFACEHFGLPLNHTAYLSDAEAWVDLMAEATTEAPSIGQTPPRKYEYIMHDVFTGGAEPLALFTKEFLTKLRSLLRSNGVIAINYAGNLESELTKRVLNTIDHVFEGRCKGYRDNHPREPSSSSSATASNLEKEGDFANLVVICRNSPGSITFRSPKTADYLGSISRKHRLLPKPIQEVPLSLQGSADPAQGVTGQVLTANEVDIWSNQQMESALKHWRIMRGVMPDAVWDLW